MRPYLQILDDDLVERIIDYNSFLIAIYMTDYYLAGFKGFYKEYTPEILKKSIILTQYSLHN